MKLTNRRTSRSIGTPEWRMTDDGFLRCTARIQQEKILEYSLDEMEGHPEGFDRDHVAVLVPVESLSDTESLKSLEGAPVVAWDHAWTDPSIVRSVSVGNVSGAPRVEEGFLVCDLLITDSETIAQIKDGALGEISAAYHADTMFDPGEFDGKSFDATQREIRYNHVAVIPPGTGRAGTDVRITNCATPEDGLLMATESKMVRVQSRVSNKYLNMDEKSAEVYSEENQNTDEAMKKMASDVSQLEDTVGGYKAGEGEIENLKSTIQDLEGQLAVYKQKAESSDDGSRIEEAALKMMGDRDDAGEILANTSIVSGDGSTMDEPSRKEYMNSIKSIHGDKLRASVLSAVGIKVENMSPEALGGAWSARKQLIGSFSRQVAGKTMLSHRVSDTSVRTVRTVRTARERLGISNSQ